MKHAYYLTGDPVSRHQAKELARRHGLSLTVLGPRDPLPPAGVLICDWDSLGDEPRERVLDLTSNDVGVLLHSYELDFQRQKHAVWQRAILVCRRLDSAISQLTKAVKSGTRHSLARIAT